MQKKTKNCLFKKLRGFHVSKGHVQPVATGPPSPEEMRDPAWAASAAWPARQCCQQQSGPASLWPRRMCIEFELKEFAVVTAQFYTVCMLQLRGGGFVSPFAKGKVSKISTKWCPTVKEDDCAICGQGKGVMQKKCKAFEKLWRRNL